MFAAFSKQAFEFGQQLLTQEDDDDADDDLNLDTADGIGISWDWKGSEAAPASRDGAGMQPHQTQPVVSLEHTSTTNAQVQSAVEQSQPSRADENWQQVRSRKGYGKQFSFLTSTQ